MDIRAQVSVEFLIVLILLLGLLLFSLAVFSEKNEGFILSKENYKARLIANQIAEKANTVLTSGNGAEVSFRLKKLEGFEPSVAGNAVRVSWRDNFVDSPLLTNDVTVNNLALGEGIKIKNQKGEIVIDFA